MQESAYPPIADYALIGDSRSAALVSRAGSIEWCCWPRFDNSSVFGRILDRERGGHFTVAPAAEYTATRRYIEATNVLETTFETPDGVAKLIDCMPVSGEVERRATLRPLRQILRIVEGIRGEVPMQLQFRPRPRFGTITPTLQRVHEQVVLGDWGAKLLHLRSDLPLPLLPDRVEATFVSRAHERHYFALGYDEHTPAVFCNIGQEADRELQTTIDFWRDWSAHLRYHGPYREVVLRSVLALKLMAYAPSGAIIAAPTTSLPEWIGGTRNWDYRYCWLRDAAFTTRALYDTGFPIEGSAFVLWLLHATRLTRSDLQVLYDVFGESRLIERELDHLEGYRRSAPVRIGNGAHAQFQLDIYGEVLGAVERFVEEGESLASDTRELIRRLVHTVMKRWRDPDHGIWEIRSAPKQHVHGKVMAWMAMDCARRIAERVDFGISGDTCARVAANIKELVLRDGLDPRTGSLTGVLGEPDLDASLLYVARSGFLDPADPRLHATIDAIRQGLGRDDLVYRYRGVDDGVGGDEGAFLPCSFWLAEALALAGQLDEAHVLFERLLHRGNDLLLFSEEVDPATGELLGNFPQALTHVALLNAALTLESIERKGELPRRVDGAEDGPEDDVRGQRDPRRVPAIVDREEAGRLEESRRLRPPRVGDHTRVNARHRRHEDHQNEEAVDESHSGAVQQSRMSVNLKEEDVKRAEDDRRDEVESMSGQLGPVAVRSERRAEDEGNVQPRQT